MRAPHAVCGGTASRFGRNCHCVRYSNSAHPTPHRHEIPFVRKHVRVNCYLLTRHTDNRGIAMGGGIITVAYQTSAPFPGCLCITQCLQPDVRPAVVLTAINGDILTSITAC